MKYTKDIRFMGTIEIKCLKKSRQVIDSSLLTEDMVSSAVDVNKVLNLGKLKSINLNVILQNLSLWLHVKNIIK